MEETTKRYSVIVSKKASQMLRFHSAFLAKVSTEAAKKLVTAFRDSATSLEYFPHRCSWMDADYLPHNKYRYLIFEKRYLMIFQIKDNTVYIDYVVDCRQNYQWLLK